MHACVSTVSKIGTVWNPPWTEAGDHGTHPRLDLAGDGPTDPGAVGAVAEPAPPPGAARPYAAGPGRRADPGGRRGRRGHQRRNSRALAQPVPGRGLGGTGGPPPQRSSADLHGRGPGGHVEEAAGGAARRPHLLEPEPDGPGDGHLDRPAEPLVVGGRDPAPPRAHLQAVQRPPVRGQAARRDRSLRKKRHPTL